MRFAMMFVCLLCVVPTTQTNAQEGFSLSKLNPFQSDKDDKNRASATISDSDSFLKMPKLKAPKLKMPSLPKRQPQAKQGPSTMQKLGAGTKRFFSQTSAALQPWKKDSPSPRSLPNKREATKKSSPFSWLLPGNNEPAQEVRTPNEFLALPRP